MKISELKTPCYVIDEGKTDRKPEDFASCNAENGRKDPSCTESIQCIL